MQTERFDTGKVFTIFQRGGNFFKRQNFEGTQAFFFFFVIFVFQRGFFFLIMCKQNCQGSIWAILSELQMKVMGFLKTLFTLLNTERERRAHMLKGKSAFPSLLVQQPAT